MATYNAPLKDMYFLLHEVVGLDRVAHLPGCEEATYDVVNAVLEECAKFSRDVLAPINHAGDVEGAQWHDGNVVTAPGFKQAYKQFADAGWTSIGADPEYGGQGMPELVSTPVKEMIGSANLSFSLCPMLTQGAIEAIHLVGTDAQKRKFLPKLVSGEWTGTMNLTEPQAGSDLAAIRTKAVPEDDHYRLYGQKIFITFGEHDCTDNIIHMVLARTPTAPEGVKGISMFIVPKFLVNDDGSIGERNDVRCVSIEHKLGIHASPTCVLQYGDKTGAIGYLIGEENRGLEYMFIMMNLARFAVGLEGLSIAEAAYQHALAYAKERIQGTEFGKRGGQRVPIVKHPDVKRMLLCMKAQTEAMRAVAYYCAACLDNGARHSDEDVKRREQSRAELMIPIVKGWSTEIGQEVTSIGVQVHGGMGFIEETGAAQFYRDARITTIYEGTTGIQANDLIGRKLGRDGGAAMDVLIADMQATVVELNASADNDCRAIGSILDKAIKSLSDTTQWTLEAFKRNPVEAAAGAVPYLMLFGTVAGAWMMGESAIVAAKHVADGNGDRTFYQGKLKTARFYADHILPRVFSYAHTVTQGADSLLGFDDATL